MNHIDDLPSVIASLWHYSTVSWLRLTLPNKKDTLRSRWKTHPTWRFLSKISWDTLPNKALVRVRKERIPSDDYLFTTGLGAITSYMAREGIDNLNIY